MRTLKQSLYNEIHRHDPKPLVRELKKPLQTGVNSPWRPDQRMPFQGMSPETIEPIHEKLIKAELEFNAFQIRSGMDIIHDNMDPQTAAELQNQQAAMDEMQRDPFAMENAFDPFHGQDSLGANDPMHNWLSNPMSDPLTGMPQL